MTRTERCATDSGVLAAPASFVFGAYELTLAAASECTGRTDIRCRRRPSCRPVVLGGAPIRAAALRCQ